MFVNRDCRITRNLVRPGSYRAESEKLDVRTLNAVAVDAENINRFTGTISASKDSKVFLL